MAEVVNDEALIAGFYATTFAGASLGTEEELSGATIWMRPEASALAGIVRHVPTGAVLVLITRDIQVGADGPYGEYQIELRTTPAEAADVPGWDLRRRALQVVIWAIDDHAGKALGDDEYRTFRTEISNADHRIGRVPTGGVAGAGRQSTVGVAAADLGAPAAAQRQKGVVHPLVKLPWYHEEFTADLAVAGLPDREKAGYALVMSAIFQLAVIWTKYPGKLHLLDAKNTWVVRPRTPPLAILGSFGLAGQPAARAAIASAAVPGWAARKTSAPIGGTWDGARQHILDAGPMGGHPLPAATVGGQPAMLFEYRHAPSADYPHAFWHHGELTFADYPDD